MRKEEFEEKVQRFEHHRLKKTIVVPAVDAEVIRFLRVLKEPITLFGEGKVCNRILDAVILMDLFDSRTN